MDVRHCPRCELRFDHLEELKHHLVIDHNVDPEALDNDYPGDDEETSEAAGAE